MKLLVIGSSSDSHIIFNSPYVSSYHAEILLLDNGDILLEDKGSRNGTFYKDQKLQPNKEISIKRGENVRFANMVLDWNQVPRLQINGIKELRGIGTNFRNKYQLQGDRVSRFHATMKKMTNGKWYIQDHSTNGTKVNGVAIPKEQDVQLKKGDRIQCAGVNVPNPCDEGGPEINWRLFTRIAAAAVLVIAICFGLKKAINPGSGKDWKVTLKEFFVRDLTDAQIYERYRASTVMVIGGYYYEVTAGDLNFDVLNQLNCNLSKEVIIDSDGDLVDVSNSSESSMYSGTAFFISADGKLVTNLHLAKPWLFTDEAKTIEMYYKQQIQTIANKLSLIYPDLPIGAYVSEVKVEGKLRLIGIIPDGYDFDGDNYIKCKVVSAGDDTNVDIALLHTVSNSLPDVCSYVKPESVMADNSKLKVGDHIYTLGYPKGPSFQSENQAIKAIGHGGSIIQIKNDYQFSHDADSEHGASGSPIFDSKGRLVGVLDAGYEKKQGFNSGIKASYVKELIEKAN